MKFIYSLAVISIAQAVSLEYATSEGTTKADNGEADETVLARADRDVSGWVNPNSVTDSGSNDEWVVVQVGETSLFQNKGVYKITDKDGDGVEDNVKKTYEELDRFYKPAAFSTDIDDIHNTHQGGLPGHRHLGIEDQAPVHRPLYNEIDHAAK